MDQMKSFTAYEYKEITMRSDKAPFYLDCYESFGWQQDENFPMQETKNTVLIRLKRGRKLVNRTELTRLQRSFEAGMDEITALEHSKTTAATIWALCIALAGTAFMAGSVFAVTADPPRIVLCILLAVPAFAGWIAPYFVYRIVRDKKTRQVNPFIEEKTEEITQCARKARACSEYSALSESSWSDPAAFCFTKISINKTQTKAKHSANTAGVYSLS